MLTAEQERQFRTFGFVVIRNFFRPQEVDAIRDEFNRAAEKASRWKKFDGTKMQYFKMLGSDTPFYSTLPEDSRFYEAAEQLFGERTFAFEVNAYRYVGNTYWHYNDGCMNTYGCGVKFQFALEPVDGNSGALRFIPCSHQNPFQDQLADYPVLGKHFRKTPDYAKKASGQLDKIPCCQTSYDPGDVVVFDLRIMHATYGGSNDRRMSCVSFFHYPETPQELETMRHITPRYMHPEPHPEMPWHDGIAEEWLANPNNSEKRRQWINCLAEISRTSEEETGMELKDSGHGSMVPVPRESC